MPSRRFSSGAALSPLRGAPLALWLLAAAPRGDVDALKVTLVKVTSSQKQAAVTKAVKGQLQPLKGCYDLALKDSPELKGELALTLTLEAGSVAQVRVSDSSPVTDETVAQCVMARLRTAAWPKTKTAAEATVRLKLAR